jgi:hypothetical protein
LSAGLTARFVFHLSGKQLDFSWPSNYTGWLLQSNASNLANSNGWFTVSGSAASKHLQITVDPAHPSVFYLMAQP